ncbi:ribonuclease P protein component [Patescibacteria group bacterium]|nr:ribonuclease P protein component [Patescibacteria group bacterium]
MLPKEFRLKINEAKNERWGHKRNIYTPLFKVIYRFNKNSTGTPRIGFIVSGKVGGSIQRNRVRRVLSEAVWKRISEFPNQVEIIIISIQGVEKASHEEISDQLNKVLSKINISSE